MPGLDFSPFAMLPLYNFGDEGGDPAEYDRTPFDQAFRSIEREMRFHFGPPSEFGTYYHNHRPEWIYQYSRWTIDDAQLLLIQNEHDIQFGMDVTLWVFPRDARIPIPLPW